MVGLMVTSSKRAYATRCASQVCFSQCLRRRHSNHKGRSDSNHKGRSDSASVGCLGPGAHEVLFEPSKHLWQVWGLILNATLLFLPSCWGFSFALGHGLYFFGGIQHSPVDGCSATSCNFGVLTGEGKCTSFYSTISSLLYIRSKVKCCKEQYCIVQCCKKQYCIEC